MRFAWESPACYWLINIAERYRARSQAGPRLPKIRPTGNQECKNSVSNAAGIINSGKQLPAARSVTDSFAGSASPNMKIGSCARLAYIVYSRLPHPIFRAASKGLCRLCRCCSAVSFCGCVSIIWDKRSFPFRRRFMKVHYGKPNGG